MGKLSTKTMLGYGPAGLGDAAVYSLVCTFLLFFLTTVAGIQPAAAGMIIAIGSVSAAFFNGIMGYISDNVRTRWGRRVPFMMVFGILLFFATLLLFTSIGAAPLLKFLYYTMMVLLFYLSYTGFFVPWLAMGAEFTQDYQERTKLRAYAAFFNMIGSLTAMVVPSAMVGKLTELGLTTEHAWMVTAGSIGLLASLCVLISTFTARGFDTVRSDRILEAPRLGLRDMFRQYWNVLQLGPIKPLLFSSIFFLIAYSILISDIMYYLTYDLGMSSGAISLILLFRCICGTVIIPLINWICAATDKRTCLILVQFLCAVILMIFGAAGIGGGWVLFLYMFFMGVSTVVYWQVMPAIIYDVCEYDELETGRQRQGTIVSIQGLVEFISSGLGTQLLGIILQLAGFHGDAAVQTAVAQVWIEHCITFIPAIFLLLSCIALWKYPITKRVYEEILRRLSEQRRAR